MIPPAAACLPPEPLYLPFEPPPFRMTMGLAARDPATAILFDEHYPAQIALRRAILAEHGEDVASKIPGSDGAVQEMLERILQICPGTFVIEHGVLHNRLTGERHDPSAPLLAAATMVQEDLCLLALHDGMPHLVAGTLCFSPGWRLREKLGLPLADVHGPVPFYQDRLARPVDRLMTHLRAGKLAERLNWGLQEGPALFRPARGDAKGLDAQNVLERIFLRVERQTLSLLERSSHVLFTIRTHVYPLSRVVAVDEGASRLCQALVSMPHEMRRYKRIEDYCEPLLQVLDSIPNNKRQSAQ